MFAEEVEVVGNDSEQASSAQDSSAEQSSTVDSVNLQISRDELASLLEDKANDAARSAAESVTSSVNAQLEAMNADISSLGTVSLVPEQYETISSIGATGLHAQVVIVGLLSLLLGAVIATAMTLHWRGRG